MTMHLNRSSWLSVVRFCYRATFTLIGVQAINMWSGLPDPDGNYFVYSTYLLSSMILSCVFVVNTYPVLFLRDLYRAQETKRFRFGVFIFVICNFLTGYLWYFIREVRGSRAPWAHQFMP